MAARTASPRTRGLGWNPSCQSRHLHPQRKRARQRVSRRHRRRDRSRLRHRYGSPANSRHLREDEVLDADPDPRADPDTKEARHAAARAAVTAAAAAVTAAPTTDNGGPQGAASTAAGAVGRRHKEKRPLPQLDRGMPCQVKELFFKQNKKEIFSETIVQKYPM